MRPAEKLLMDARGIVEEYIDFRAPILRSDFGGTSLSDEDIFQKLATDTIDKHLGCCGAIEGSKIVLCARCGASQPIQYRIENGCTGTVDDYIETTLVLYGWTKCLEGYLCPFCFSSNNGMWGLF